MHRAGGLALILGVFSSQVAHADDFDPHGRRPSHGRPGGRPGGRPAGRPGGQHPDPAKPGATADALIGRYTNIVLSQPGATFPLQRLAQLYRERDGKLDKLVQDLEAKSRASGGGKYAATVALAGVYQIDGKNDQAAKTYEAAIRLDATRPAAIGALARLLQDRGDTAQAIKRYEQVLALEKNKIDREQTLRTLMTLCLDAKQWDDAKKHHRALVALEPKSLYIRGDLGRELFSRGLYSRAADEFKSVVDAAHGDNRVLAPALKDWGRALAKAHRNKEALAALKHALRVAGSQAAVRAEAYQVIAELYRADQKLPELITQLEAEHPNDFDRLALLGGLYEETGAQDKALATYRKAIAKRPNHIDLRLRLIRLLQASGELDKAIAEYDGLIRAAPNNPRFVFEQCEALIQRGDRARALTLLTKLEARASRDEDSLGRLADFYGRIGEHDRAVGVLKRLAQLTTNDPSHLVDLGDHYYQQGQKALAMQTWRRILTTVTPRSRALAALGDVYLEHDMTQEALQVLREALKLDPNGTAPKKHLAVALERSKRYGEARALWESLAKIAQKKRDALLAREARTHIVSLWSLERTLPRQAAPLEAKFAAKPPDVEAGRMLGEVYIRLRKYPEAERTFRRIIKLEPGDENSYLALERVLVQRGKHDEAIVVLEKLASVSPKRARALYKRMSTYAQQIKRDQDAIRYAARAVELNPDDAEGHRNLGELYAARQDFKNAIREFRTAIARNERLYVVYFELAELLMATGKTAQADDLYRRVVRGSPDEELIARAARLSMQIHIGKGSLETLEQELLPLAIGNPQRPMYRRLLVEIYGHLTFGLVRRLESANAKDAAQARTELAKIGARAIKPLLDALADSDSGQQRIAIDVLGHVENKNAGPALFAFATSDADLTMRTQAMLACARLRDPKLLGRYSKFLMPHGKPTDGTMPSDRVAVAAVLALAELDSAAARPLLGAVLKGGTSDMRAIAAIGLAAAGDKRQMPQLVSIARAIDAGSSARAGAALSLGWLGGDREIPLLVSLAQSDDGLVQAAAITALAEIHARSGANAATSKRAASVIADALFPDGLGQESEHQRRESLVTRQAAASALAILAKKRQPVPPKTRMHAALASASGDVDVEDLLVPMLGSELAPAEVDAVALRFAPAIEMSARAALETSAGRALSVVSSFGPPRGALLALSPKPTATTAQASAKLLQALAPELTSLTKHPNVDLRLSTIKLLSQSSSKGATDAVADAVLDKDPRVARAALSSMGQVATPRAVSAAKNVLETSENWSIRVLAIEALGRMGRVAKGSEHRAIVERLSKSATKDSFALVREAALRSLADVDQAAMRKVADELEKNDEEPRIRKLARQLGQK